MYKRLKAYLKSLRTKFESNEMEIVNVIYVYRYLSWLATSLFYLIEGPSAPVFYKISVIGLLFMAAKIIMTLYVTHIQNKQKLQLLILAEAFGITLLLIPTGGLNSPFIWYALNPVLVAASYLSVYFCWFSLIFYLTISSYISMLFFKPINTFSVIVHEKSYLILVFVLITLMVQLLAAFTKKLRNAYKKQQESMDHIMSLYQTVETLSTGESLETFFIIVTDYAAKLFKTDSVFLGYAPAGSEQISIIFNKKAEETLQAELEGKLHWLMERLGKEQRCIVSIGGQRYLTTLVKSSASMYGVLGIKTKADDFSMPFVKQLDFLSELSAIVLERFSLEQAADKLLIVEERNRIANEIHDSVSQRLFSMSYALHALKKKCETMDRNEMVKHFEMLANSSNSALQELRNSIYSLSTKRDGKKVFFQTIEAYLNNLAELNDIYIDYRLQGEERYISTGLKKAIYRIVCEATGNAVRHGKSNNIQVRLLIEQTQVRLQVIDNGSGFNIKRIEHSGLGMGNIKHLVNAYNGQISMDSDINQGTEIKVLIPLKTESIPGRGGIA